MKNNLVLVVDDEKPVADVLGEQLKQRGFEAGVVYDGTAALTALERLPVALVLSDLKMNGMSGLELLRAVRNRGFDTPFVMLSAHGNVATAMEAIREGAADFLEKPWDIDRLAHVVRKELEVGRPRSAKDPRRGVARMGPPLLGGSKALEEANQRIKRVSGVDTAVLLLGEPGTGKELAAQAIHEGSARAKKPFVAVDCGRLSEDLFNAEVYGTVKGAFTNATDKPGRVEIAEGGSLFIDEVGELSNRQQSALLRLLQERTFERVGSNELRRADVRVIAATNRPLKQMVKEGTFREDLLSRLDVATIQLPPLREHPEDIGALARHFIQQLGEKTHRPSAQLTDAAVQLLTTTRWDNGNVRQLLNFLEAALVFSDHDTLEAPVIRQELVRKGLIDSGVAPMRAEGAPPPPLAVTMRAAERAAIVAALEYAKGKREVAALVLDISKRSLQYKIAEYEL